MPISTVSILKYVQQCYGKWFWTISSLGAPVKVRKTKSTGRDSRCFEKMSNSFDKYDNKHIYTRSSWQASLPFAVFFQTPTKERLRGVRAWHNVQFSKDASVTLTSEYLL